MTFIETLKKYNREANSLIEKIQNHTIEFEIRGREIGSVSYIPNTDEIIISERGTQNNTMKLNANDGYNLLKALKDVYEENWD